MKSLLIALFLCSSMAYASEKVKINGKIYVAQGFDDNDLVEVTVIGSLPDSCHRNPTFEVMRKENNEYAIYLYAYYVPNSEGCRKVSVPYQETINLGMMYSGEYTLSLVNKRSTERKNLTISRASSYIVDEFLYGNVNGIVENDANREIKLIGVNPINCLKFEKMDSIVQGSMIILKPHFKEVGVCRNIPTTFTINYKVPDLPDSPRGILLHVRVMNGRSYNYFFQNKI